MKRAMRCLINIIGMIIFLSSTFTVASIVKWIFVSNDKILILTLLSFIVMSIAIVALYLIYLYLDKQEKLENTK